MFIILWAFAPTLTFWIVALGLHLWGVNQHYTGKVTIRQMVASQVFVDTLQTGSSLLRIATNHMESYSYSWSKLIIGLLIIELFEYVGHRALHTFDLLRPIHKQHHQLLQLHTLGAYYNDPREVIILGGWVSFGMVFLGGLNVIEIGIVGSLATIATVLDHCPLATKVPRRHERHHRMETNADFAQPFTGFWDFVCKTRYSDVHPFLINEQKKNNSPLRVRTHIKIHRLQQT